ncbi:hypothetical protein [Umezawaea tangerina]|uniref:Uncharacterized protein n=1 Tax=Umezawaea tangerina TaxID=84725 RepID=A0A2T0TCS8_9PSEU|nr:hypothetical protein [Umezawaea tangerina]PRY43438.1 hypothetical protein CLV43_103181 [Umezawaea tangerina]
MSLRSGDKAGGREGVPTLVNAVLVGAGTLYVLTGSLVLTIIVTLLAVCLAVVAMVQRGKEL